MYKKYRDEAIKIYNGFNNRFTNKWLANSGLSELHKMLLDDIASAKNDTEFERAKYQFKLRILDPFYKEHIADGGQQAIDAFIASNPTFGMEEPKSLGSYDELKKNPKLASSTYARKTVDKDGKELVDIPLLRIVNDEKELSAMAGKLHVSPEELRDHVLNEWDKKKKREWPEIEKKMKEEILKNRKGVLKDFNKNILSGILKTVAPEIYAGMRRDIAEGKGESGSVLGWVGEHKKDAGVDAARNGLLAMSGFAPTNLWAGIGVAGTEAAALAASDYYPVNIRNLVGAATSGYLAGTVPSFVGRFLYPFMRSGNSRFVRAARAVMRKYRSGEPSPSKVESDAIKNKIDDAYFSIKDFNSPNSVKTENDIKEIVDEVYELTLKSPETAFHGGTVMTKRDVWNFLQTKEGVIALKNMFNAPSLKTYTKWVQGTKNASIPEEDRFVFQKAIDKANNLYPMTVEEIKILGGNNDLVKLGVEAGASAANALGSRWEPMAARNVYEEGLSSYEASNPEQVEYWKRYGIPDWDPLAEEFNEKYGEGR